MIRKYQPFIFIALFLLLVYTRFVNLGWGLPYPMHPDERNMVDAVIRLRCDDPDEFLEGVMTNVPIFIKTYLAGEPPYLSNLSYKKVFCANPNFFAYGQIVLYMAYVLAVLVEYLSKFLVFSGSDIQPTVFNLSFSSVAISLRIISALSSMATALLVLRIFRLLHVRNNMSKFFELALFLLVIFSPVLIQFAHYGTTESILTFLYTLIIYLSLLSQKDRKEKDFIKYFACTVIVTGFAIAAKVSSLTFSIVPLFILCVRYGSETFANFVSVFRLFKKLGDSETEVKNFAEFFGEAFASSIKNIFLLVFLSVFFIVMSAVVSFLFSPHNVISHPEFLGSFSYERDVGTGRYVAFYTRQFLYELPLIFHIRHIFPYALGSLVSIFFVIGFIFAPWSKQLNTLRFSIIFFCILTMPWYAKWTRFIAPIYPIIIIFSVFAFAFFIKTLKKLKTPKSIIQAAVLAALLFAVMPGLAQISVYSSKDVRYTASRWVVGNIPARSKILSETANVIDIPVPDPSDEEEQVSRLENYSLNYVSFNFYNLDEDSKTYSEYLDHLKDADYIFVPSRRVFYNHTCISEKDGSKLKDRHSEYKCKMLEKTYPRLINHYEKLFSGKLGFEKVAEFKSYPKITFFGKTIVEFPDEEAEETFTVFDHPVIRIYKRIDK